MARQLPGLWIFTDPIPFAGLSRISPTHLLHPDRFRCAPTRARARTQQGREVGCSSDGDLPGSARPRLTHGISRLRLIGGPSHPGHFQRGPKAGNGSFRPQGRVYADTQAGLVVTLSEDGRTIHSWRTLIRPARPWLQRRSTCTGHRVHVRLLVGAGTKGAILSDHESTFCPRGGGKWLFSRTSTPTSTMAPRRGSGRVKPTRAHPSQPRYVAATCLHPRGPCSKEARAILVPHLGWARDFSQCGRDAPPSGWDAPPGRGPETLLDSAPDDLCP